MSDRPTSLLLIDDDPIFCLGLATALAQDSFFQGIEQAHSPAMAWQKLAQQIPDIVILEPLMFLGTGAPGQFCQQLRQRYPQVRIFLLSRLRSRSQLIAAQRLGIEGYAPKGTPPATIKRYLQTIAAGETCWGDLTLIPASRSQRHRSRPWLVNLQQSGIRQIEQQLAPIDQYLRQPRLTAWDRLYWSGRQRELGAARWLVQKLIPVDVLVVSAPLAVTEAEFSSPGSGLVRSASQDISRQDSFGSPVYSAFERTLLDLRSPLIKATPIPLAIDILPASKQAELMVAVLERFRQSLDQLQALKLAPRQLPSNSAELLQDVWQDVALAFLVSHLENPLEISASLAISSLKLDDLQDLIDDYGPLIQGEVLDKIPFLQDIWGYFLFEQGITLDKVTYRAESLEAMERATLLLQNLVIAIANGVMVFILNNFSEDEAIKSRLFQPQLKSSREIARFRNTLTWHYRFTQFWENPKNIFESQYPLFYLGDRGLESLNLYAPRLRELKQLRGIPWIVTILLEFRDAVSPQLRSVVGFLGNGLVYLLTQVIGRGIGLVGRGIIQGIGNALQDNRYGKNRQRRDSQS